MIKIKKLFNKGERGTHKGKVKVTRGGKTFLREQRVGKKSPREGTGKMDKFPQSIKKEILDQRSFGESGAKIKSLIEDMIDHREELKLSPENEKKLNLLYNKRQIELDSDKRLDQTKQIKNIESKNTTILTYINGKSTGRNLVKEGLITNDSKLTVTSQALTNWAKSQVIESTKKRTSAAESEKSKHEDTKKELDQSNKKVARLEVAAKHNLDEIKLVQQSKQESDKIRGDLRKDNIDLKSKLKACLAGEKS